MTVYLYRKFLSYFSCITCFIAHFSYILPHYTSFAKPDPLRISCNACLITHFLRSQAHYTFIAKPASLHILFEAGLITYFSRRLPLYPFILKFASLLVSCKAGIVTLFLIFIISIITSRNIDLERIYNFILSLEFFYQRMHYLLDI